MGILILSLTNLPGYYDRVITGTTPGVSFDIDWPPGNAFFVARNGTDLEQLTAEALRVIQETMEPEHVSVWLRPAADD